ncbi:MAG TPA: T9SS type A sorting domain-containing protein [Phaeodactylibacter sp.]|nr:T9SS type A sorting domain-containing protein [Phaeodactylibacter sp.]
MKKFVLLFCISLIGLNLFSQNQNIADHWFDANEAAIIIPPSQERRIIPQKYRTVALDLEALKNSLAHAPMEFTTAAKQHPLLIALPLPDGENAVFEVVYSPVMAPGLAAKFPQIKSFTARGRDNHLLVARIDYAEDGFRGIISTDKGQVFIDPYVDGNNINYIAYYKNDRLPNEAEREMLENGHYDGDFIPSNLEWLNPNAGGPNSPFNTSNTSAATRTEGGAPVELRVYRMALATTGEYSATQGGTVSSVMSEVVHAVGRLNFVYEKETAVRFQLIPNNDEIIFLDSATDPYSGPNVQDYFSQNTLTLNSVIGVDNYDIGHLFAPSGCMSNGNSVAGTSGGLGIICSNNKARGVSCTSFPSDNFYLTVLAHEVGHQLGAPHPWSNCSEQWNMTQLTTGAAYSPGSGNTIMSYAGACGVNNVQFNTDIYLHVNSVETIYNFTRASGNCATVLETENTEPEVTIPFGDGLKIPISTPFQLTGAATDVDVDDTLTYCWEQYNLGPLSQLGSPIGNAPSFRSFYPTENPTRVFPRIQTIVANMNTVVEVLPEYSRNLTFRCTVRDSKWGGGGTVWEEISFDAVDVAGPFLVAYPNVFTEMEEGAYVEVTWDVANTDVAPVNCHRVNILLSTDGGYTYPVTLAQNIENTGSYTVLIPDAQTNTARIKIEAADNIFFDISDLNFRINPPSVSGFAFDAGPFYQKVCLPDQPVFNINTLSLLNYDSLVHFETIGLPAGVTADFSANPVMASETATLTLNVDNTTTASGNFAFQLMAYVEGGDTLYRNLTYETVSTDFSDFGLLTPSNGEAGVGETPTYTWNESAVADEYRIEIASNPSFETSSIVGTAMVTGGSYSTGPQLNLGEVYYWRVRPQNECATGEWSEITAFAVKSLSCENTVSTASPITIPANGLPEIESVINIPFDAVITDLNVKNIQGHHNAFKDLAMTLVGPDGTEVELFHSVFCLATQMDFGLDDDAPTTIGTDCPVNTGIGYQPENPLSVFNGKNTQGDWTLKVAVINTAGAGGKLNEWTLQLCSEANLSPPVLVKNETMPLPPAQSRSITNEFLLTEDPNNIPEELIYTIVTAPQHGQLSFFTDQLGVGDKFTQKSSSAGNIKYTHDGSATTEDSFTFTVEDGEGGLIATPQFNLLLDPDVMIATEDILNANDISIFPNPANELINIGFSKPINEQIMVRVFSVQGKLLGEKIVSNSLQLIQIPTHDLASGIYFLQVQTGSQSLAKKITVQR